MRALSPALCSLVLLFSALARAGEPPIRVPRVLVEDDPWVEDEAAPSTVIDRSDIEERAVADLPGILDQQPGMRTPRLGGLGSFSTLSLRGSTGDQVLVLVDGIPLNAAAGGPVDLSTVPLGPVDAVVIYRGVTPITASASAIGGAVSIHTRALDHGSFEVEAGGGAFGTRSARTFYGIGEAGSWGLGVSVDYLGSQGDFSYVDDSGTLLADGDGDDREVVRDNNAFDQIAVMARANVTLGPGVGLRVLDLLTWRDRGLPGLGLHPTKEAGLTTLRNLAGLRLDVERIAGRRVALALGPWLSWSTTRLSDPKGEIGLGADETRDVTLSPGVTASARVPFLLDEEGLFALTPAVSATWRYDRFEPGGHSANTTGLPGDRHFASAASEVAATFDPIDLELVASIRYEHGFSELQGSASDSGALTWRGALVQSSIPRTRIKANVARSVRFPSLFELFGNTGFVLGNPELDSEVGLNVDLGFAHGGDNWTVEAFGFYNEVEGLIQLVQNGQGVAIAENVDAATLAGVEIGAFADLLAHVRLRGSLTWMRTENTTEIAARRGRRLPGRPEWQAFARAEGYHRFSGAVGEVGLALEIEYLAGSFQDFANLVEVPERVLIGASAHAGFLDDELMLRITAANLTDDQVQDFVGFPLPGLTVLASLRWAP